MKIRNGFVSNSSSASFVVKKSDITEDEAKALLSYQNSDDNTDYWSIREQGDLIVGWTSMDNDALDEYLDSINFDVRKMQWESDE